MADDLQTIDYAFDQGLVNSDDASALDKGELSKAVGCEYHPGSKHLYKLGGRADTLEHLAAPIQAIQKAQYDVAASALVAVAGGTVYESVESTTPDFASVGLTGLSTASNADPMFTALQDQWVMCNGIDSNYTREAGPVNVPGWTKGHWRKTGLFTPNWDAANSTTTTTGTTPATTRPNAPASGTGDFVKPEYAYDTDTTSYAIAVGRIVGKVYTTTWTFAAATPANGIGLYVYAAMYDMHSTLFGGRTNYGVIEYTLDNGVTWIELYSGKGKDHAEREFHRREFYTDIADHSISGDQMSNFKVRVSLHYEVEVNYCNIQISDIVLTDQGSGVNITYGLQYGYTEVYIDAHGIEHESNLSNLSPIMGAATNNVGKITLTLPGTAVNECTTALNIYRNLDDNSFYPAMWLIGTVDVASTKYVDLLRNTTDALTFDRALEVLTITYPTNEQLVIEAHDPPPVASCVTTFQGSVVYASANETSKLYYSRPGASLNANFEYVPSLYYLSFETGANDSIKTLVVTNGGKSLLVFFETYTMVVYYLPQATDPGVFENRVRDYISSTFGSAGRFTAVEFFINERPPLVASVSPQGLWITDGVSLSKFWSDEINWTTIFAGVDLSTAKLFDNPAMRRLELLYTAVDGTNQEYHFFYGMLEQEESLPRKTGPHPTGVRTKHYCTINGAWQGFTGDKTATGAIFLEGGYADASNGYDAQGNIPFDVTTGEFYVTGYSGSHLVGCGYPKFGGGLTKTITLTGSFSRDIGTTFTKVKSYTVNAHKKVWWHRYCDRHKLNIQDISATQMPALIGYSVEVREGGVARNKSEV